MSVSRLTQLFAVLGACACGSNTSPSDALTDDSDTAGPAAAVDILGRWFKPQYTVVTVDRVGIAEDGGSLVLHPDGPLPLWWTDTLEPVRCFERKEGSAPGGGLYQFHFQEGGQLTVEGLLPTVVDCDGREGSVRGNLPSTSWTFVDTDGTRDDLIVASYPWKVGKLGEDILDVTARFGEEAEPVQFSLTREGTFDPGETPEWAR